MDLVKAAVLNKPQAVGFVPSVREGVQRDLAADNKPQAQVAKVFYESGTEFGPDLVLLVVFAELVPLGLN